MIIQRISIGGVAGDSWRAKEMSSQEVQDLVKFADGWDGVNINPTNGDYTVVTITTKTSAEAEFFEQRFGMFLEREARPGDAPPPQNDSTGSLSDDDWT